jgi:DNA-binding NtrC family response regulator
MGNPLRVLIVDDSEDDALLLVRELRHGGYDPIFELVSTAAEMEAALSPPTWDIILCDYVMPRFDVLQALKLYRAKGLHTPVIVLSGVLGEYRAAEVMKAGAKDYIAKDDLQRLVPTVARLLAEAEADREAGRAPEREGLRGWWKRILPKRP